MPFEPNMIITKAIFTGKDGSLGFQKSQRYFLKFSLITDELGTNIQITSKAKDGTNLNCTYSSLKSFLTNWHIL